MVSDDGLLFIEPAGPASEEPLIDHFTRRMTAAVRAARPTGPHWMGFHQCGCGAVSANHDFRLPGGAVTNSLCVHYVAHHRGEVPAGQLARVAALAAGEADPEDGELQGPRLLRADTLAHVRHSLGPERLAAWAGWGLDVDALPRHLPPGYPMTDTWTPSGRNEAAVLLGVVGAVPADFLPRLAEVVGREHGGAAAWGSRALCVPGWDRGAWAAPLAALARERRAEPRRAAVRGLRLLGAAAAAAGPALVELAWADPADRELQQAVRETLADWGPGPGFSLLTRLPPRPGQPSCVHCSDTRLCFCRRGGVTGGDPCPRCGGSGRCHVCDRTEGR
jgi:hypothetical protein